MDGLGFAIALAVSFAIGFVVAVSAIVTGCLVRRLGDLFARHEHPDDHEMLREEPR